MVVNVFTEIFAQMEKDPSAIVFGGVGVIFGIAMVLNGWAEPSGKISTSLKDTSRIKNLLWVVGGAITALTANWKLLFQQDVNNARILLIYMFFLMTSFTVTISVMTILITLASFLKKETRAKTLDLTIEYLHYGYKVYKQLRDKTVEEHQSRIDIINDVQAKNRIDWKDRADRRRASREGLAALLISYANEKNPPAEVIKQVLKFIEGEIYGITANPGDLTFIRVSYMRFIEKEKATNEIKNSANFQFGNRDRYVGYLKYENTGLIIPVDRLGSEFILPGAPKAYASASAVCFDPKNIVFEKNIPSEIKRSGVSYFKGDAFKSCRPVTSIPIDADNGKIVGILNIDTNLENMVGMDDAALKIVCDSLKPSLLLLAQLISREIM